MRLVIAPVAAAWLGASAFVFENVMAGGAWRGTETDTITNDSVYFPYAQDSALAYPGDAILKDPSAVPGQPGLANAQLENFPPIADKQQPGEPAQPDAGPKRPDLRMGQGKRLSASTAFRIAAPLLIFSLGLLAARSLSGRGESNSPGDRYHSKGQQARAKREREQAKAGKGTVEELLEQADRLVRLESVAAQLAENIENHESHLALQEFSKSVNRTKELRQALGSSSRSLGSSENVLRKAVDRGFSALSQLYEVARQHALHLVQETRGVQSVREFSYQELKMMETYLGSPLVEALENHMASLKFSCRAFALKLDETEATLEGLPELEKLEDEELVDALSANLQFIKAAHEAATVGRQSAEEVASSAVAVTLSHVVRQQTHQYRDCRDFLQERRALCKAERQRQQSLPDGNPDVLHELDTVEALLDRGETLLQKYKQEIEDLQKEREIMLVEAARLQADDVGRELKTLLDVAVSRLNFSPASVFENKDVEDAYAAIASRASQEAAEASKKVADIGKQVESRVTPEEAIINEAMMNLLMGSLQQAEENADVAAQEASAAAAAITEGTKQAPPGRVLMSAARCASGTADSLVGGAELLWLHAQLLESLESDLRVSANLARLGEAAETAGVEAGTEGTEALRRWVVELPEQRKAQLEDLQRRMRTSKSLALSHWSAKDLALTAASVKNAATGIATLVQQQQLKQTGDLIQ
ncbi:hypothetical protein, conserved [Eimeria brunetti]|uniref:Myosin heavy chain n=1 Tax=Eimeria brunetti TaxID=51314 RepID=U6L9H6_9EIME|nr:hypothetical protein, conserved [Eimeria brunetti]